MNDKLLKSLKSTFDPNTPTTLWLTASYLKKLGVKTEFPHYACPDRVYTESAKLWRLSSNCAKSAVKPKMLSEQACQKSTFLDTYS